MNDNPISRVKRGIRGRFISKNKEAIPEKKSEEVPTVTHTFYNIPIRKFLIGKTWHFSIDDILNIAAPCNPDEYAITFKKNYQNVKNLILVLVNEIEAANAEGILKLIKEVNGTFPGPLERWLKN
jgi:hypothetical protein